MGFKRVTTGATNILDVKRQKERQLKRIVEEVGRAQLEAVDVMTPRDTGMLVNYLRHQDKDNEYVRKIGPLSDLSIDKKAPPGTIADFVQWYQGVFGERPGRNAGKLSWYTLDDQQKRLLRERRTNGESGGPYPPPVYFGAVNEGKVPGQGANHNVNFVDHIREQISDRIPDIIKTVVEGG